MTAMTAIFPTAPSRSTVYRPVVSEDDDQVEIESGAVRAGVEEVFLGCTISTGSNGHMLLGDLLEALSQSNSAVVWSESRLAAIVERCDRLVLVGGGLVVWSGSPDRSGLLRRIRSMIAVRKSKISPGSLLTQLQRGSDRYDGLTERQIRDIANALPEFRVIDGAVLRSGGFALQAADVLNGDELRIFKILQKTVFALTAEEINRKLGRRPAALHTILPILNESPVISNFEGGYRSIIEMPTQLGLRL